MNGMNDLQAASRIENYPAIYPLSLRWTDLDADRHLSELAVSRYAEQGRSEMLTRLMREAGLDQHDDTVGMLVAGLRIRFVSHRPARGDIRLATGIARTGRSSVDLRIAVFDDRGCLAVSDNAMVFVDRAGGRPVEIPAALRPLLAKMACENA